MIKKIDKLVNFGIFKNFSWTNTPEFGHYNVIYGLNGSGKTTISNLFDCISTKNIGEYTDSNFAITTSNGQITPKNIDESCENIYVFNKKFVERNLGEFKELKGIIFISEKNITLKEKLDDDLKKKDELQKEVHSLETVYEGAKRKLDQAFISAARDIKEEFHILGGAGNKFSNYTKANFSNDLTCYGSFLKENIDPLDLRTNIESNKDKIKDEVKPHIDINLQINTDSVEKNIVEAIKYVEEKFESSLKTELGERLYAWLNEGFHLHANENICQYCGNIISPERQLELSRIFNTGVEHYKNNGEVVKETLKNCKIELPELAKEDFYKGLQSRFSELYARIKVIFNRYNNNIDKLDRIVSQKMANPHYSADLSNFDDKQFHESLNALQSDIEVLETLISENNSITKSYAEIQKKALEDIKKYLVYQKYHQFEIKDKASALRKATEELSTKQMQLQLLIGEIDTMQGELVDVIKASKQFNMLLAKFLGRDEIILEYDAVSKGYKVIRSTDGRVAINLSEGEKTAIAFVYFLTKVHEMGNEIANSIVVFDDPISSMDSNHIYNAFSFVKAYFENAAQLFVLTHNFTFFKLMRRFVGKEKKFSENMYLISNNYASVEGKNVRVAKIEKLPKCLLQASSEYAYLFKVIVDFNKNYIDFGHIDFNGIIGIANICRKILEIFCSFKIGEYSDFRSALELLYKNIKNNGADLGDDDKVQCERIYKFTNAFSHQTAFYSDDDIESLFSETNNVVGDILNLIKLCDENHYNALLKQTETN